MGRARKNLVATQGSSRDINIFICILQDGGRVVRENSIADSFYNVEIFVNFHIIKYVFVPYGLL